MGQPKQRRIAARPFGLLLAAGLLPVIVLSTVFNTTLVDQQRTSIERDALDRSEALATLLDHELRAQLAAVDLVAQTPSLDSAIPDEERLRIIAERVLRHQPLWRTLSISDAKGNRIIDIPEPIGGRMGGVVDTASHARALATKKPVFGNIIKGSRGSYAFAMKAPVIRDGQVRYVISAVLHPEGIRRLLLIRDLPEGWNATLFDGHGSVVAATDSRLRPGTVQQPPPPTEAGARELREITNHAGERQVAAHRRLANVSWTVQVSLPEALYAAPLVRSLQIVIVGSFLTLLLTAWFLWLFLRDSRKRQATEAALEQSQRLEALGQMTGGVAHDLNNLLTPIVGALDMIRRKVDDPRSVRLIDGALTSAERARTLIGRLLAFARRQQLDSRDVAVRRLLDGMADLLERSIGPTIRLVIDPPEAELSVRADPNQLELALLNLAVNARDAMPNGGTLTVAAAREQVLTTHAAELEPGDYVRLSVTDTGEGMDAATAKRAVEPFFSTKEQGHGTGLGLSMVHGLAAQSGGALLITSEVGKGTRIDMWLPAGQETAAPESKETAPIDTVTPLKLLLVDDEELVRAATAEMMREAGHHVDEASSGQAAIAMFAAAPDYDVVVSDYAMPGMSGGELARRLRELSPSLKVLLVTGYARDAADIPPGVPRLDKPFRAAELLQRLQTIAEDARLPDLARQAAG